jgi:hypothetical protein
MTTYKEKIFNAITGEETWRDFTDAEVAEIEFAQQKAEEIAAEAQTKEAARAELLARLGITADEAKLLLGSN